MAFDSCVRLRGSRSRKRTSIKAETVSGARGGRKDGRPGTQVWEATLYNCKVNYSGMNVSGAKRLRSLEDENRKLKKLLAESILNNAALKELL